MSSHRVKRTVRALSAAAVAVSVILVSSPAVADPDLPDDASEAVRQLAELNRESEVLTEQWHFARDQLDARQVELERARADAAAATAAGEQAKMVQEQYRGQVDLLTNASFQGARFNRWSALLVSDSPQEFLEQMSALDMLAADHKEALDRLTGAVTQAKQAEQAAKDAVARAGQAEQDAARLEGELAQARDEMDRKVELVEERLAELNDAQQALLRVPGEIDFPIVAVGSGVAAAAVRAALTRQGSPYRWGGEGPNAFDCSGLVKWSYAQAGVSGLPHSSRQQAQLGSAVSRPRLRPGDLIALYSPVSHIGIYVGNGRYVHAPQAGDVVKVSPVPWGNVTAMRRIA